MLGQEQRRRGEQLRRPATVGLVVVLVGALAGGIAWARSGPAEVRPSRHAADRTDPTPPSASGTATPVVPARRAGAVRAEVPTGSVLPGGHVVPVVPAGTAWDGRLAVPEDIRVAGWWRGGARLGDPFGSTLIAAHVDSFTQGLGPFASLLSVTAGQRVTLRSSHLTQTFSVVSLALVPRGTLARHPRIFSARGPRRLTLVTCAGPYDRAHGGYQNLAVVTARPVQDAVPRSGT